MKYRKKLDEIAYYLGTIQIFKPEVIYNKIRELEVDTNQFLFEHSIKHRRAYCKSVKDKSKRSKIFYFKEKRYFRKHQKKDKVKNN